MNPHPSEEGVWSLLDGELDRATAIEMEQHVSRCASCARTVAELRRLEAEIETHFRTAAPLPATPLDVWRAAAERRRSRVKVRRRAMAVSLAVAAAAVLVFAVLLSRRPAMRLDRVEGWLLAGSDSSLEFSTSGSELSLGTRVVSLHDTVALIDLGRASLEITGSADLELTSGGAILEEGSVRVSGPASVEISAIGVGVTGDDFDVFARPNAPAVVTTREREASLEGTGDPVTIPAHHRARLLPGTVPWIEEIRREELTTAVPPIVNMREEGTGHTPSSGLLGGVKLLADGLSSTDPIVRRRSVEAIGRIPVTSLGLEVLAVATSSQERTETRVEAVESLARLASSGAPLAAGQALTLLISDSDAPRDVRFAAARAIKAFAPSSEADAALESLAASTKKAPPSPDRVPMDPNGYYHESRDELQSGAGLSMPIGLASKSDVRGADLARAVEAFEGRFRRMAIRLAVLGGRGDASLPLVEFLDDSDPTVAAEAALALGLRLETTTPEGTNVAEALIRAMKKRAFDDAFQVHALFALSVLSDPTSLAVLTEAMGLEDPRVRRHALLGIDRLLRTPLEASDRLRAVDTIRAAIRDGDDEVRGLAGLALASTAGEDRADVAAILVQLLADPSDLVRAKAASSLVLASRPEAAHALRERLVATDESSEVRAECARSYAKCAGQAASPILRQVLREALGRNESELASSVLMALWESFDGTGEEDILAALGFADPVVRIAALTCLEGLVHRLSWPDKVIPLVGDLASADASPDVRAQAVRALSVFSPSDLVDRLLSALADPSSKVSIAAASAIAGKRPEEAESCLARWIEDGAPGDRARAADAVRKLFSSLPDRVAEALARSEARGALGDETTIAALLQVALAYRRPVSAELLRAALESSDPMLELGGACALARTTGDRSRLISALSVDPQPPAVVRALGSASIGAPSTIARGEASDEVLSAIEKMFLEQSAIEVGHALPAPGFLRALSVGDRDSLIRHIDDLLSERRRLLWHLFELASSPKTHFRVAGTLGLGAFSSADGVFLAMARLNDAEPQVRDAARLAVDDRLAAEDSEFDPAARIKQSRSTVERIRSWTRKRPLEPGDRAAKLLLDLEKTLIRR